MKFKIENLGILKEAGFELGDFTILCGKNNTGKTYATYAMYGFLELWSILMPKHTDPAIIRQLLDRGVATVDLDALWEKKDRLLLKACESYLRQFHKVFAVSESFFSGLTFDVQLNGKCGFRDVAVKQGLTNKTFGELRFAKDKGSSKLELAIFQQKNQSQPLPEAMLRDLVSTQINKVLFERTFPPVFIASAERTGVAIFQKELDFARNRILDQLSEAENEFNPFEYLNKVYGSYSLPIRENVDYVRKLPDLYKNESELAGQYPDLLNDFEDIIGGSYQVKSGAVVFVPKSARAKKLQMNESSSAVRSLLDIGFYLKHNCKKGDLLIVDEPELNLHPENQCRLARLFARLVHAGVKVFITTHSDYIVKEINTLVMLNADRPGKKALLAKHGYRNDELLIPEQLRVYIAQGKTPKAKSTTLVQAPIDSQYGIRLGSFDETINRMNEIQNDLIWG